MSVPAMINDPEMKFLGLTRVEYDALVDGGGFDDEPVELIEGGLFPMGRQGPMHARIADRLSRRLNRARLEAGEERYRVRLHSPLVAGDNSEPAPDR